MSGLANDDDDDDDDEGDDDDDDDLARFRSEMAVPSSRCCTAAVRTTRRTQSGRGGSGSSSTRTTRTRTKASTLRGKSSVIHVSTILA